MFNLASAASVPQAMTRSGEQLRGSVPASTKAADVDWEADHDADRDILARLPLDRLLREVRVPPPKEALENAPLKLLDASRRSMSPRALTPSSVLVHVYNLNEAFVKANKVLGMATLGAFHAGVEIFGWEWSYGVHGVKKSLPRVQTRHVYKCSVFLGHSEVNHVEFVQLLTDCFQDFGGDDYELVGHNCCSFARALVKKLGVRSMPSWVDRLARGLNLGAKATRMAGRPLKKAAALGGRVLRMGRSSDSEDDDDYDLESTGGDDIPGQIAQPAGPSQPAAVAAPPRQAAPPQALHAAHAAQAHAAHAAQAQAAPRPVAHQSGRPGFPQQWAPAQAQVPNPAMHKPVVAAGYATPAPVYVAQQAYPMQVMHPAAKAAMAPGFG